MVFGRSMKAANLPSFLKFWNAKKSDIRVIFAKKITGGHETGGGAGAKLPPGPGLKPPPSLVHIARQYRRDFRTWTCLSSCHSDPASQRDSPTVAQKTAVAQTASCCSSKAHSTLLPSSYLRLVRTSRQLSAAIFSRTCGGGLTGTGTAAARPSATRSGFLNRTVPRDRACAAHPLWSRWPSRSLLVHWQRRDVKRTFFTTTEQPIDWSAMWRRVQSDVTELNWTDMV